MKLHAEIYDIDLTMQEAMGGFTEHALALQTSADGLLLALGYPEKVAFHPPADAAETLFPDGRTVFTAQRSEAEGSYVYDVKSRLPIANSGDGRTAQRAMYGVSYRFPLGEPEITLASPLEATFWMLDRNETAQFRPPSPTSLTPACVVRGIAKATDNLKGWRLYMDIQR